MSEKSGSATGTVTRGNTDISSSLVVTLTNSDTTEATFTNTVTIAANQASATFTITSVDDTILDGTQTITISASATGYVGSSTTLDVTDFETLTVSVNPVAMSENGGTATGTVTRGNTDRSQPLIVTLTSGDTTEATMATTVTIAANQASATFPINAVDDNLFDGVQVVSIGVSATGYVSGSTTISVTDAESVSLSANVTSISERGGTATGTVTRSNTDGATDLVVTLTGNDSTEATVPASVTILAGQQSATFTITAVDDTLLDGSRAVTFTAAATGYSGGLLIVTVTDYESLTVTLNQSTLSEKGGTTTATITRSNTDNSAALTVTLASGDTSEATTPASVTIPANIASATFTVTTVDDTLLDGTQTVAISGSAANYVSVPANLDVTDFETLSLVINPTSISENGGSATATVTRNNTDLGQELVVNVASNDTTEASVPATVTIPANQASTTFTVSAVDDTLLDGTRTAAISVTSPGYIAAGGNVLVSDYESLSITLDTNSVAENAGSITGTVTRSNTDNSSPLTVTLAGNDATEATVPATVVIPANQSSATFTVTIVDDNEFDGTQTVTLTATATSYVGGSASLDVTDFEQLTIAVSPSSMSENGGTTTGTVTRNNTDRSQALTVSLASTDPSQASLPASVTIPANATSATFSISALDDTLLDGDQSLTLTASAAGYVDGTTTLVVTDHETLTVTLDVSSISENGGSTTGTVRRNNTDLAQSLTVTLTTSDTTEATVPASVTIAAGEETATFTVSAVEDFAADGSQSATIGATATGYVGGSANITVTDFNHPPTDLTLDKTTVAENASGAIVGAVNVVDPDTGETFSFTLSDSRFEVVGGNLRLKTGQSLDFETEPNVSVTITARDSGNAQIARTFSLQTTDANERPTNIQLSSNSVTENVAGAVIGDLSVVDPDAGDTHTLSVADARFEIVSGQLRLKAGQSLDYEAGATVSVDVTARDAGGLEFTKSLSISLGDVNDAPTAIQVTPSSVRENLVGATIGQLSATDQDVGQTHSFTTSDSRFEIVGSTLRFKSDQYADFGAGSTITVSIQTTDNGSPSQSLTQNVVITVIANPFPWQNPIQALDTDNDNQHAIAPVDILLIINLLNGPAGFIDQSGRLPRTRPATSTLPFYDTNGDSFATPQDALLIINYLNRLAAGGEGELPEPAFAPNPNALNPSSPMPANITGGAAIHDAVLDELTLDGVIAEIAADVARRRLTWSSRFAR
ncbi:MAG TPA: Calx-beta domain-containing protein, partial [Pirellulaceae bacterium]|nr:Calx-beta domain-containing protein [Pirellulaceae bacterium]